MIVGLPRSGTTYLSSLLNSHKKILCAGELFNPYSVIETREPEYHTEEVYIRDVAPRYFLRQFFEIREAEGWERIGFKFMLGHNLRILTQLPELTDVSIIYVHRENRLAQAASYIKALDTNNWAQVKGSRGSRAKIDASPQRISHYLHEYATTDFLFSQWFAGLPQRKMTVEYRALFAPGFNAEICNFLGLDLDPKMKSPLVKQGANRILDRFVDPKSIEVYMRRVGREAWLEDELS